MENQSARRKPLEAYSEMNVMADGRVFRSFEAENPQQQSAFPEKDTPDPATYVSSLKTDEFKAELNKHGLKRSGN